MERITTNEILDFEKNGIEAVRKAGAECMVLLKNSKGVLPLEKPDKIALYGSGVRKTIKGGTGSGDVNIRHFVTVEEGIKNAGVDITTTEWLDKYDEIRTSASRNFFKKALEDINSNKQDAAMALMWLNSPEPNYEIELVGEGEVAVYVLTRSSGEGVDRESISGDILLSETEIRDILRLNEQYKKFVLVLNVGGVVDLTPVLEIETILLMSQLGTASGDALADVLFGKSYPSGKLTATWAPIENYPSTKGFGAENDTYYEEGVYVGYRYFDTVNHHPTFSFGFGLGYTEFSIDKKQIKADEKLIIIEAIVKNTGRYSGKEIVQAYISAPREVLDKPYQELKGFVKTSELQPGQSEKVEIKIPTASLASFDTKKLAYIIEKGTYLIRLGNSSRNTKVVAKLELDKTVQTEIVKEICIGDAIEESIPKFVGILGEEDSSNIISINLLAEKFERKINKYSEELKEFTTKRKILWSDVEKGDATIEELVGQFTNEELAYMCVGQFSKTSGTSVVGNASEKVAGGAGETTHFNRKYGIPELVMADGPAGLRLSPTYIVLKDGIVQSTGTSFKAEYLEVLSSKELAKVGLEDSSIDKENLKNSHQQYYQYCTAIPIGTALAQSWNEDIAYSLGDIVGKEMELFGVDIWLSPALNIQRSPLCGRNFEYLSEDPLVSGKIASAIVRGVQSHKGKAATIKHYAANNQETNRYNSNSVISQRALREIYLKGFEMCVKESDPRVVMSSYNLINKEHACESKDILTYTLRDEWGFKGFVMSDWYVTGGMETGLEKYPVAFASKNIKAGNDITMPGSKRDIENILEAIDNHTGNNKLTREHLQEAAIRILKTILELTGK